MIFSNLCYSPSTFKTLFENELDYCNFPLPVKKETASSSTNKVGRADGQRRGATFLAKHNKYRLSFTGTIKTAAKNNAFVDYSESLHRARSLNCLNFDSFPGAYVTIINHKLQTGKTNYTDNGFGVDKRKRSGSLETLLEVGESRDPREKSGVLFGNIHSESGQSGACAVNKSGVSSVDAGSGRDVTVSDKRKTLAHEDEHSTGRICLCNGWVDDRSSTKVSRASAGFGANLCHLSDPQGQIKPLCASSNVREAISKFDCNTPTTSSPIPSDSQTPSKPSSQDSSPQTPPPPPPPPPPSQKLLSIFKRSGNEHKSLKLKLKQAYWKPVDKKQVKIIYTYIHMHYFLRV